MGENPADENQSREVKKKTQLLAISLFFESE